jgi:hypothetical protein
MAKNTNNGQKAHYFSIAMTYAKCEDMYRQHIKFIIVTSSEGKRIQLPKANLQKFITPLGLNGNFRLLVDQNNKIVNIEQVATY